MPIYIFSTYTSIQSYVKGLSRGYMILNSLLSSLERIVQFFNSFGVYIKNIVALASYIWILYNKYFVGTLRNGSKGENSKDVL